MSSVNVSCIIYSKKIGHISAQHLLSVILNSIVCVDGYFCVLTTMSLFCHFSPADKTIHQLQDISFSIFKNVMKSFHRQGHHHYLEPFAYILHVTWYLSFFAFGF